MTFLYSSPSNPCPICGRTKDGDCRISQDGDLVLCHKNFGDTCPDGWRYVKPAQDDRTGIFVRDYPKTNRPWGQTFKHPYQSFKGTTHTHLRRYKPDRSGKICRWDKPLADIKETDLLPYRWDKVKDSPEIFLVEGELCVDALLDRGLPATCVRSWSDRQAKLFKGKTVILMPDCDREGLRKADKARELLSAHGVSIKWCYLPGIGSWEYPKPKDGLDVYDYFQLGGTVEELRSAISGNPIESIETTKPTGKGKDKAPTVFELLMTIVEELDLYKEGNEFGATYADVVVDGVRRTYKVRTSEFKSWITGELYRRYARASTSEALETCLKICEAKATGTYRQIWYKTATYEGKVYIDLCNDAWEAIEVSKDGWRIVRSIDLPVRFARSPMQNPLPVPVTFVTFANSEPPQTSPIEPAQRAKRDVCDVCDVSLLTKSQESKGYARLWELLPFAPESEPLVIAWLLSCLVPDGEKPILVLSAPKGSGKSTIARFLVTLIDPTKADLLPSVGDSRALAVQSRHRWIFAYDNLTYLSTEQQDALCRASTGAGYMERKLFTDDEVTFIAYRRPQILTSVDLVPTRSDLLDRCLLVKLRPIPESDRKPPEELDRMFEESRSEILGALLDLLVTALANLDKVSQPLQRMASFHRLGLAAGIPAFNETYLSSIERARAEAVSANPISDAIAELGSFEGTAEQLLTRLKEISDDPRVQKLSSRSLGKLLNGTLKADLESIGFRIDFVRSNRSRTWFIYPPLIDNKGEKTSQTSQTSQPAQGEDSNSDVLPTQKTPNVTNVTPNPPHPEPRSKSPPAHNGDIPQEKRSESPPPEQVGNSEPPPPPEQVGQSEPRSGSPPPKPRKRKCQWEGIPIGDPDSWEDL